MTSWDGVFLFSAFYAVDSFFLLGAFIAMYHTLSYLQLVRSKLASTWSLRDFLTKAVPGIYLHRWLRLTPSYAFILFVFVAITPFVVDGPFTRDMEMGVQDCHKVILSSTMH